MNTAALTRDPFMPRPPRGRRLSLAMALLAHALLIAGLVFNVDWHTTEPNAVEAELWSAVPRQAAPREVAPEPPQQVRPVVTPPPPPPPPPVKSQPVQPPQVDPQIAIEKAKKAEAQREQAEEAEQEKARREKARQAQLAKDEQVRKKALAEKTAKAEADKSERAEKEKADQAKADKSAAAAQQAAARAAYLKRMQGLAGASGDSNATGTALKSSGPSSSYAGRIMARIKPNIVFSDSVDGNPSATVEVKVAPDGTITGRRLVQSSGVKAWDDAVLRAIDRTDGLPRDIDGRVQPLMLITFKRD